MKYQRSPTKWGTNTPSGVGADSSRPYPNIIKYTYSRHKIRVSVSPHTHIHIINYVFLHHQIHISISSQTCIRSPFRGGIRIRGHDKSDPYSCERFAIMLLTDCQMCPNGLRMRGEYVYAGTINRPLRLRTVCDNAADGLPNVPQRIANALRIRICGHDKSDPYGC